MRSGAACFEIPFGVLRLRRLTSYAKIANTELIVKLLAMQQTHRLQFKCERQVGASVQQGLSAASKSRILFLRSGAADIRYSLIVRIIMTWSRSFVLFICIFLGACTSFYSAKTPEGVDLSPILTIPLSGPLDQIDMLKSILPNGDKYSKKKTDAITFNFDNADAKDKLTYRRFTFYRFDTQDRAVKKYTRHKEQFTDRSNNWKLFKEEQGDGYTYFSSYKTPWMDTNHGIPTGHVITYPEILVGIQKKNLLIVVSFTSYRDDVDYIDAINKDIVYVGALLKKLASASQQNAPMDVSRP